MDARGDFTWIVLCWTLTGWHRVQNTQQTLDEESQRLGGFRIKTRPSSEAQPRPGGELGTSPCGRADRHIFWNVASQSLTEPALKIESQNVSLNDLKTNVINSQNSSLPSNCSTRSWCLCSQGRFYIYFIRTVGKAYNGALRASLPNSTSTTSIA